MFWIFLQTLFYKHLQLFWKIVRKYYLLFNNISQSFWVVWLFKRSGSSCQLKCQNSNSPNIDLWVVVVSFQHFRRKVIQSSTKCSPSWFCDHWPSEVCKFYRIIRNKNILRFNISMYDMTRVKVSKTLTYLFKNQTYWWLWKESYFLHNLKKLTFWSILKNQSDWLLIPKIAV